MDNPHLTSRLEKGALLVLLWPVVRVGEDHYRIGSEDGLRYYEVIKGHCQCTDYLRHGARHPCRHRLALALFLRLQGRSWSPLLREQDDGRRRVSPVRNRCSELPTGGPLVNDQSLE